MMGAPIPSSFTCPVVIGRTPELALLRSMVEEAQRGVGHVLLLAGEAGIGKSRLVTEAKVFAKLHGFHLLLEGQCFQTDCRFPYAPLLNLFRSYFAGLAATSLPEPMRAAISTLAGLLPDLTLQFPDLATASPSTTVLPEEAQRWLFAAITHYVKEQAAQQPVLLVVEDIHWSDDLSLDLLFHLIRRCRQVPLLFLITYRSDEHQLRLRPWLNQLDRERLAQECALDRLSRADVASMLHAMVAVQQEFAADLFETVYTCSEGNPFFVEELFKSLVTTRDVVCVAGTWKRITQKSSIPRSVQEMVQQRTAHLSAEALRLITLAAVAGRRFDVTLLLTIMRADEAHFLHLLKEVMAAHLVVEEAADQFAFRHALTQQAITASLLLRERQALHRCLAETMEELSNSSVVRQRYLEDLADHYFAAGIWERALLYAQAAGEKALTLYAQQAAIDHFTRAVAATQHLSQTPPSRLYLARGQAYETLGDFDRARGDYELALGTARALPDRAMEWQSMMAIGCLWAGHDYAQAGVWLSQALALAEALAEPTLRARSLNRLGNWLLNTGELQAGLDAHQEALRLFEMRVDRQGMAETLEMLGMAYFFKGDPAKAVRDFYGRTIALIRDLGDRQALFSILTMRALDVAPETIETTYSALLTHAECVDDVEEALSLARQTNSLSGQAFVEMATAYVLASFGACGSAFAHAQEALRIATNIEHHEWIAAANGALGLLYLLLLDPDKAVSYLEVGVTDAQLLGSAIQRKILTPYLAIAYIQRREFPRARAVLTTIMPSDQPPNDFFERQAARAWGELALAQGDALRALAIADSLIDSAPGELQQPIPHLLTLKGEALIQIKRLVEASTVLENAKLGAVQRQAPSILWRCQRALGQAYHLLKNEEQAQREWSAASDIIAKLAATIDDMPLREHFLRTALATLPQRKRPAQKTLTRNKYSGLTARECEVAILIGAGRSNREIAATLVVSERTAEVHVSNILGKLGFTTRAQIAVWVVKQGLTARLSV